MLFLLAMLASSDCVIQKNQCRVCTVVDGKQKCSLPGIACQPIIKICKKSEKKSPRLPNSEDRKNLKNLHNLSKSENYKSI